MDNTIINQEKMKIRRRKKFVKGFIVLCLLTLLFLSLNKYINEKETVEDCREYRSRSRTENIIERVEMDTWNLILVNKNNPLPKDYQVKLYKLKSGKYIDKRICYDLKQMFEAMRDEDVYPNINSAYRSFEDQDKILRRKINKYIDDGYTSDMAKEEANLKVANPGESEHQTGLALDISGKDGKSDHWSVYQWLKDNSYKYGFILRYPEHKLEITNVSYEPWHYRYVGKEAAKEIYEEGICLEEYIENYLK